MLLADNISILNNNMALIDKISLSFSPGQIYGILGPNGAGKSTLLKALSGIWKLNSGAVLWNNRPLHSCSRKEACRIISLVPQNPQVSFDYSVFEIVSMGCYSQSKGLIDQNRIEEALKLVDAWHLRDRSMMRVSSGERQRAYIARSLVMESPVLLLDEPTANLDIRHQLDIWKLLKSLAEEGKTIVVSVHDFLSAKKYCDIISIVDKGKVVATGTYENVMTPTRLMQTFGVIDNEIL